MSLIFIKWVLSMTSIFKSLKVIAISHDLATIQVKALLTSIVVGYSILPHCIAYVSILKSDE